MPQDNNDKRVLGRAYRGELAPPVTTPEEVAAVQGIQSAHDKPGAVTLQVYFVTRGIDNPIWQASMSAYTRVRTATVEAFDDIFESHHNVVEGKKP